MNTAWEITTDDILTVCQRLDHGSDGFDVGCFSAARYSATPAEKQQLRQTKSSNTERRNSRTFVHPPPANAKPNELMEYLNSPDEPKDTVDGGTVNDEIPESVVNF